MKFVKLLTMVVVLLSPLSLSAFDKTASNANAKIMQEGQGKEYCPICGMKLKMYYKTNHAVKLKDGLKKQYCSIRCLASDFEAIENRIDTVYVVDAQTQELIEAKNAYYVLGSMAPGTMSVTSKYAFAKKSNAKGFIQKYEGKLVSFEKAFAAARQSLENDVAMVQRKKEQKMYPMGKKLYSLKCSDVDTTKYDTINILKESILKQNKCQNLNEKQLQAVALYLWEVKRFEHNHATRIDVPQNAKCPVCGMFVAKYPKWAALISHDGHKHYFDGAKDMFKYYFEPKKYLSHDLGKDTVIYVTDYYSLEAVPAQEAFYVIGSSVTGPMGHEFVPFKSKNAAQEFKNDYKGRKVLSFEQISKGDSEKLDMGDFNLHKKGL